MEKAIWFTVEAPPRSKKNSSQIVTIAGRPRLLPSKQYREYEKVFLPQVPEHAKQEIDYPVTLCCNFFMDTHRKVDINNLLAAVNDLLVKAKVLKDDNCTIVVSLDGSRVHFDKDRPRVEISIIPIARSIQDGYEN